MKNLAPEIVRKRLLVEGFYSSEITRESLSNYLLDLAAHLELRVYAEPIVYAPSSGMGKDENSGFDAFVPLIDSGISAYIWSKAKFFSMVIYTCKDFNQDKAIQFTRDRLQVTGEIAHMTF